MDIFDSWKIYEDKIEKEILAFNQEVKDNHLEGQRKRKDNAKNYYLKFVDLLKAESRSDQNAFKEILNDFQQQIKKMGEYVKTNESNTNESKKVFVNGDSKSDKEVMKGKVLQAIVAEKFDVKWDDVVGLNKAKDALKQGAIMPFIFPEIFTGHNLPPKGILLYGPPGTGKTLLAKACASEMEGSTFFSISSSEKMSKYVDEAKEIVNCLFETAKKEKSSVIFIDEVASMTGKWVSTEFLTQMVRYKEEENRLLVLGATNLPWELNPAILKRFERRIYIPLPEHESRLGLFKKLCSKTPNTLSEDQFVDLAQRTDGYSGSDIKTLVKEAVYEPLRISQKANKFRKCKNEKGEEAWTPVPPSESIPGAEYCWCKINELNGKLVLPDLEYKHFVTSLIKVKPSVDEKQLTKYEEMRKRWE